MGDKKNRARFSIVLDQTDPLHMQAAELINKQKYRGKAQYIVNAVLYYENCDETPDIKRPAQIDEKFIEAVVNRILRDRGDRVVEKPIPAASVTKIQKPQQPDEEINFDEVMEAIGEDGFSAVTSALDMFRKK